VRLERGGFALTMSAVRADGGTLFGEEDESPFVGLLQVETARARRRSQTREARTSGSSLSVF
jgi:hypothetical protein